ncbi:MAG TPA: HYR domain-containing protein, partial [Phaeodactylibacter sp.]|nr:HYR domain-containing protein [Phaeodactylibacter sp.]
MPKYSDITTSKSIDPNGFARSYENRLVISLLLLLSSFVLSAQCTLSCNNNLNIALNQNGEAIVSVGLLLADPDCNPDDFTVFVFLNGQNIGNILNCNHVGYPLTAQLIHNVSGNYCTSNIQVQDYIAPQIFCSDTIVPCNSTLSPDETGYPLAMDNCTAFSNTDFNYADTYTDLPCNTQVNGTTVTARIDRKWWITDASGLADTCVQIIYQQRATVYDITFPQNLDGLQSPMLDCGQDPSSAELTGYPTVFGKPVVNDDLCELSVTYNDLEIATCGTSSYNIIRTWTAADWCTGQIITHGQIIKVKDTSPPLINCPADMNVSSSTISCGATVLLPQATATDDCSDFSIQVSWQFGTGTGPYYGVPLGTHVVTYTAQDDCGNMSTCQMTVTVVDDIAPVNICKSSLSINISSAGSVTVPASVFDDGSFDNCEIDHFEVKRQGMSFAEFISFDCQDVNASIVPVTFRVFDIYGNFNDCVVNVAVHDYIAPLITCPATVLLSCQDDYSDTTLTGSPTVADNCGIDSLYFTEVEDINDCGVGMVIRTWTVVDLSGNTGTCVQNIILEDNTPVQVSFPVDFSSSVCGIVETGTDVTGIPTIVNDDCELVDYTYTDEIFDISAPACYTILRHWVVIDWCTYVPNSGSLDGYYTHTQVISISDEEAPVLTIPASFTAYSLSANCGSDEVLIPPAIAEDCHPQVQITNDSPYAYANGADASGQYPIGMHQITFVANDGCGNVTTETMTLIVEDGLAPTVVCLSNVSVSLNANGQIQVNPLDLDVSLSDNCTDVSDLVLSLLPNVFDCTDIGTNESILTVEDAAGNTATCVVMIEVQDNQFVCGQSATLSGQLLTPQGAIMEGVEVQIVGADTSSVWTDDTGAFLYDQALVDNGYIVRPYKNTHYMNGVSTLD